jgi:outer membrane lipoprotein-sorting protein
MKILLYRIVVAALLFLIGCTPSKEVNVSRLSSPDDVNRFYVEREKQIRTFTGSGNITIETPEFSNNAGFTVTINRPDSLLIKLKGPFGISVGTLFITNGKFVFLNNVEKKIQTGGLDSIPIQSLINMPFSTNDLVNIFTGSYGYSVMDYSNARLDFNGVNYLLENNTEAERKEMTIDGANNNFLKLIHRDHYGKVITEIYARSYENVDGVNLPYWMRIIFPKQHRSLTITYDEIKINNTVNFNLSLPRELQN